MMATIELSDDQVNSIIREDLKNLLACLEDDLERVKRDKTGYVFENDFEKDKKEIKKHIKSFKRILKYYGEPL
jgi:protoporphyrinogen oxidase